MSETDDTDVLLLIPPNFFLVCSSDSENSVLESSRTVVHKPVSCTAQVLGKLVDHVHSIEYRLDSLELNTSNTLSSINTQRNKTWDIDNFGSRSLGRKSFTFPRRRRRKVNRRDKSADLSLNSLDSLTSRKHSTLSLKLRGKAEIYDSQSMDGDISSIVSTPSKKNDKLLLQEIDEFLTKVDAYESPETKYKSKDEFSSENVIKATGDYLSQKLDSKNPDGEIKLPSGRTVTSEILDKYIYLVKNNVNTHSEAPPTSKNIEYEDTPATSSSSTSKHMFKQDLHTKTPSIRKLNFSEDKEAQPTSTPKKSLQPGCIYLESFRPTSNKIYDGASKVLEQYKCQSYGRNTQSSTTDTNEYLLPKQEEFKMPQMRPYISNKDKLTALQIDSIDTDLLSLSELWGEKGERLERVDSLKLEEERLKREHCEVLIQQLQRKILEQQEKLAVAIKVDRGKDAAITKLREAWLRLTHSLDRAEERHRAALDKMVKEVDNFKMVANDAQKKTNHFEAELYKALDLAHDYQEKCKLLTAEKKELQDCAERFLANKDEVIEKKDKEIEALKDNYETVMRLNKQSTDCVKNLENTLEKERTEHELTRNKESELSRKISMMQEETSLVSQEKDILKDKVNEERSRCNMLERQMCDLQNQNSELMKRCESLENDTKTLRKHLELQKNELKSHYQQQLEDAVLAKLKEFQLQLEHAQSEMECDARSKENAIVDTYNNQIARIEEQHKLEVKVLEEKQREEIKLYRLQLAQASEKIGLLENKLESYRRKRGQIATQLHGVMESQWRQALQILTNGQPVSQPAQILGQPTNQFTSQANQPQSLLDNPLSAQAPSYSSLDFNRADSAASTGMNKRAQRFTDGLSDGELQHYVHMLLSKPPNLDLNLDTELGNVNELKSLRPDLQELPTNDRPERHERRDKAVKRTLNPNKPPWKA